MSSSTYDRAGAAGSSTTTARCAIVVVTDVRDGEQIAWHWWSDGGELSSVELRLDELDGHTRLHIVETTLLPVDTAERRDARVGACTRRWSAATSRLWGHVGVAAFA